MEIITVKNVKRLFFYRNSTSARIMYAILLLLTTIVSCIFLAPGLQDTLKSVPFCKNTGETDGDGGLLPDFQGLITSHTTDNF